MSRNNDMIIIVLVSAAAVQNVAIHKSMCRKKRQQNKVAPKKNISRKFSFVGSVIASFIIIHQRARHLITLSFWGCIKPVRCVLIGPPRHVYSALSSDRLSHENSHVGVTCCTHTFFETYIHFYL